MSLLAVVLSYIAIALTIMITFSLAYLILGAEGSYQEGSWNVSTTWVILSIIIGLGAAWMGGKLCVKIASNHTAPKYLIALIMVLGIASAIWANQSELDTVRTATPTISEAMSNSIQPTWLVWLNPIIGGLGIALGSGLFKKPEESQS